jgi:hypothetical protein
MVCISEHQYSRVFSLLIDSSFVGADAKYSAVGEPRIYLEETLYLTLACCYLSGYCFGGPYAVNLAATGSLVAGAAFNVLLIYYTYA